MSQSEIEHGRSLGVAVALGAAMGAALGAATGHVGVWIAVGIAAYLAITFFVPQSEQNGKRARRAVSSELQKIRLKRQSGEWLE